MRHGHGIEKTTLGTIFQGKWERGRKHGQGERKLPIGLTEDQVCYIIYNCYFDIIWLSVILGMEKWFVAIRCFQNDSS